MKNREQAQVLAEEFYNFAIPLAEAAVDKGSHKQGPPVIRDANTQYQSISSLLIPGGFHISNGNKINVLNFESYVYSGLTKL